MKIKLFTICIFSSLLLIISAHSGQITTDGSMGTATNLTGPNYTIAQDLGTTVGNNLFHSFGTFNLSPGDVATFTGANTIQNVISRVTDGNPSNIDGTIQSQVGNANFFFINPAGMIFGQHAAIDVPAAFHASTANELRFADGTSYNLHTSKGSLTAAAPESFGFLGRTGDIVIEGSQLKFKEGTEVSFTGNSVTSNGATIEVPRGSLRVYGNGDAVSNVPINGELPAGNGVITMNGGNWNVNGDGGGDIWISGGAVTINNGAKIYNVNNGERDASGTIRIVANTLVVDSGDVLTGTESTGRAGNIFINVADVMHVVNGAIVLSATVAQGNAGNITVTASRLVIDKQGSQSFTGIGSVTDGTNATGNSGNVNINVSSQVLVANGGKISSSSLSVGDSGNITITAGELIIDGSGTTIVSSAMGSSTGTAGYITINVSGNMQILNHGSVFSASTASATNAGNITINVGGAMQIITGGSINSNTTNKGNAGTIIITTGSLIIDGQNAGIGITGIFSNALGSSGTAGDIIIKVNGTMQVLNEGRIQSETMGSGNAGNINIKVDGAMLLLNKGSVLTSTYSTGNAGIINITANSLIIDGKGNHASIISGTSEDSTGDAGMINIIVSDEMQVLNAGQVATAPLGTGKTGDISITAGSLIIDGKGDGAYIQSITNRNPDDDGGSITINVSGNITTLKVNMV